MAPSRQSSELGKALLGPDLNAIAKALRSLRSALIDADEAARILNRSVPWTIELARRGDIDFIRHGPKYYLGRVQVETMAARNAAKSSICSSPGGEQVVTASHDSYMWSVEVNHGSFITPGLGPVVIPAG